MLCQFLISSRYESRVTTSYTHPRQGPTRGFGTPRNLLGREERDALSSCQRNRLYRHCGSFVVKQNRGPRRKWSIVLHEDHRGRRSGNLCGFGQQ
jgi:hypothetical protein